MRFHQVRILLARRLAWASAAAAIALATALHAPGPADASCVAGPSTAQSVRTAPIVFVGQVIGVSNLNRWATVAVEEVWAGPDLPAMVEVRGGSAEANVWSSVDRTWSAGAHYLFMPGKAGGHFVDGSCSATIEWTPAFDALRPANARLPLGVSAPEPPDPGPIAVAGPLVLVAAAGAVVFGTVLLARRRGR